MADIPYLLIHILLFITLYFEVFLLIAFLEKRPRNTDVAEAPFFPSVSIIVPCFNEEHTLAKTVESLLALEYPSSELEIIIVNDGSTDGTARVAQQFSSHQNVRIIHKENGGKHTALNAGIAQARGDIIGCLDADSYAQPSALSKLVAAFEDKEIMAVTPGIRVYNAKKTIERIQNAEYTLSAFFRRVFSILDAQFITPGPLSLYRKEVFERVGIFKSAYNTEDMEMALRLQSHRLRIANVPEAHVETTVPRKLRTLMRQRIRWTYGFLKNIVVYRHILFRRNYGALGNLILPIGFLSVGSALYFITYLFIRIGMSITQEIVRLWDVNFAITMQVPEFSWFFISTQALFIIIAFLISLTVVLMLFGRSMVKNNLPVLDLLSYLFLYSFIAPIWLGKAVFAVVTSRRVSWK